MKDRPGASFFQAQFLHQGSVVNFKMANCPDKWPQINDEFLPNLLFKLAARFPDITYAEYPHTSRLADGYRRITFNEVANAVHELAGWIDHNVGKPVTNDGSETLVCMGPNDLRYGMLVLSSVMVGYKVAMGPFT